jgi:anaerobic magnesium-protoporphyrin IX monomethyl ester cyclase
MSRLLLVYPFFRRSLDRSRFRFPPLGIAYLAAAARQAGHDVSLIDCTFLSRAEAVRRVTEAGADAIGISCMATMLDDCLALAGAARDHCGLLIAGGPLATCEPQAFREAFDVVVQGEGEHTLVEVLAAWEAGDDPAGVPGVAGAAPRPFERDLDRLAPPARELLPNADYIRLGRKRYGYAITTVMSTRGCPFHCEFCSNVVFGESFRVRSAWSVVDEMEQALELGYDRISFADDVFTLDAGRVAEICEQIERRRLGCRWECLARVDSFDEATAQRLVQGGCFRVYFGIESGSDRVLQLMDKRITTEQAARAVATARAAGLETGAFFILCYPGDTDDTALDTLRLASSLPLDYLGLGMPYPLPGTRLRERVAGQVRAARPDGSLLLNQTLTYDGDFSSLKMRFGIVKGQTQHRMRRRLGRMAPAALWAFEKPTDALFRLLR